jgi:hypothetical protein
MTQMASAISRNSRVLSTTVFTDSTNANGSFLYLGEVLPDLRFVLTSFSWSVIGVRVLDIDIDGCTEVNAEGGNILTEVVIILDLQVVVRATVGVTIVDCNWPPRCETMRCETTTTPGRPALGRLAPTSPAPSLDDRFGGVLAMSTPAKEVDSASDTSMNLFGRGRNRGSNAKKERGRRRRKKERGSQGGAYLRRSPMPDLQRWPELAGDRQP